MTVTEKIALRTLAYQALTDLLTGKFTSVTVDGVAYQKHRLPELEAFIRRLDNEIKAEQNQGTSNRVTFGRPL
jgi:predicted RNA-binding protein Jag